METWKRSSYSYGNGGNCLETAQAPHTVKVRDSKNPGRGYLEFSPREWLALLTDLKTDQH